MAYYFADAINGNKLIIDGDGKMKNYPSFWDIGWNTPLEVIFTGNLPNIGNSAFSSLSFTSIEIPDSVTSIGEGAFMNCTSLASIEIPDGVTSLLEKPSSQVVYVVEEQQDAALDFVQINPVQQQGKGRMK